MPDLRRATSAEELQALRNRSRALAVVYGIGVVVLAAVMIALFGMTIYSLLQHPDTENVPAVAIQLAFPLFFCMLEGYWLSIRLTELGVECAPVKSQILPALNGIRDDYYIGLSINASARSNAIALK